MLPAARAQRFHLDHRHADAVAQEVDVLVDVGRSVLGQRDVKRRAAHVDGDDILLAEGFADILPRGGAEPGPS